VNARQTLYCDAFGRGTVRHQCKAEVTAEKANGDASYGGTWVVTERDRRGIEAGFARMTRHTRFLVRAILSL
jgi:hypothetical protein